MGISAYDYATLSGGFHGKDFSNWEYDGIAHRYHLPKIGDVTYYDDRFYLQRVCSMDSPHEILDIRSHKAHAVIVLSHYRVDIPIEGVIA